MAGLGALLSGRLIATAGSAHRPRGAAGYSRTLAQAPRLAARAAAAAGLQKVAGGARRCTAAATARAATAGHATSAGSEAPEAQVLAALRKIIDPDLGADIVACGFVKDLACDEAAGSVSFVLELTTPVRRRACFVHLLNVFCKKSQHDF